MHTTRIAAFLATMLLIAGIASAGPWDRTDKVVVRTDAQLREVTGQRIPPGATLLIAPGTYRGGVDIRDVIGTEGKPIVIAGQDPKQPPVFVGGNSGMHIVNPSWLELRDIVFEKASGNSLNIDDGGSDTFSARRVTLRNIVARDMAEKGNHDGIKLSGLSDFRIEGCTVSKWGVGGGSAIDMVGCRDGVVVDCTFSHNDPAATTGVQMKGGSHTILIDRCRFDHASQRAINIGGHTGKPYFRPQPPPNFEAKDITVRRCLFLGSMAPICFVGVDGATVEECRFENPEKWVLRILQENRDPQLVPSRRGVFRNNAVVFRSQQVQTFVNISPGTSPETFVFEGNWWYCQDNPTRSKPQLPTPEKDGVYGKEPK